MSSFQPIGSLNTDGGEMRRVAISFPVPAVGGGRPITRYGAKCFRILLEPTLDSVRFEEIGRAHV